MITIAGGIILAVFILLFWVQILRFILWFICPVIGVLIGAAIATTFENPDALIWAMLAGLIGGFMASNAWLAD